ncbi:putative 5-formyltetrahydrofolate cyclo-ligase [bacterium BMS3Abin12]|nr:putative 5-formyltetrahydrofolate cyclo-ligase [bacterium BMS3Abin12]HDJ85816.1 5-formyltetrahydrofolate cyclo-ligase [Chromatiales bacterium]
MDPTALRREMRRKRRALDAASRAAIAERIARRLAGSDWFLRSRRVAAYLAVDGELDPAPLLHRARALHKTVYLPVLDPLQDRLWFAPYRPGDALVHNRFGIPEPAAGGERRVAPWALDLVLAPLVAFDPGGGRLGMGGGFYDRTFAYLRARSRWRKPRLLGMAYGFQEVAALPHRPWDIRLQGCATERALYRWEA